MIVKEPECDDPNAVNYTAFARDVCGGWLHLNDKAVTRTTLKALNGPLPYVLFYKACCPPPGVPCARNPGCIGREDRAELPHRSRGRSMRKMFSNVNLQ